MIEYPVHMSKEADQQLAEYIEAMQEAETRQYDEFKEDIEFEKFLSADRCQNFLSKMTVLVDAYTANGYISEEQYELTLFKKAKAILKIEFESLK